MKKPAGFRRAGCSIRLDSIRICALVEVPGGGYAASALRGRTTRIIVRRFENQSSERDRLIDDSIEAGKLGHEHPADMRFRAVDANASVYGPNDRPRQVAPKRSRSDTLPASWRRGRLPAWWPQAKNGR